MIFVGFLIFGLVFFLRECLEDAVKFAGARLEGRNDILGRRLEEGDDVADEFVLALDSGKCVNLVGSDVGCFFNVCAFEGGKCVAFLDKVLQEFCRGVAYVCAHKRGGTVESVVELAVITVEGLKCLVKKCVLDNDEFDVGVEAGTAELRCLFSIEAGSLYEIETVVSLDGFGNLVDYFTFIFLFHFVRGVLGLSLNRFGVDFDARTHGAGKINALDICAFGGSGFELNQGVDKLAGVVAHLLGAERHLAD